MSVKIRRLLATIIDGVLFMIMAQIVREVYIRILPIDKYYFICCILYYIPTLFILTAKDILFGYESIGKKILKLHIYGDNNEKIIDKKVLFKRVFFSLFNIYVGAYPLMVLIDNKSFGDKKMKTTIK